MLYVSVSSYLLAEHLPALFNESINLLEIGRTYENNVHTLGFLRVHISQIPLKRGCNVLWTHSEVVFEVAVILIRYQLHGRINLPSIWSWIR